MPEKLNLPEESFIITEVTIIEQYLFLTERTAKETARKPLKKFEKLLYYSQFLFSNNHYMYRELPQEELHIPEEFAVIIKLWYQYLCQNGYLTPISATSLIGADTYFSYSQANFQWTNMSKDFLVLFIYFVKAIATSYDDYCNSHCFSASKFFELVPQDIKNCNQISPDVSQKLIYLYDTISEECLEKKYLCALEDFYTKYSISKLNPQQQNKLRNPVHNLTAILMCQEKGHSVHISNYLLCILKEYIKRLGECPNPDELPNKLFPHYKPIAATNAEINLMNDFISKITSIKDKHIEKIAKVLQIQKSSQYSEDFTVTSQQFANLEKLQQDFFAQLDLLLKKHTYDFQAYYAKLTLEVKCDPNTTLFSQSIEEHKRKLCQQLCKYCDTLKKEEKIFFKNIRRLQNNKQKQDSSKFPFTNLKENMTFILSGMQEKLNDLISNKNKYFRLPTIAQAYEPGLLQEFCYWSSLTPISYFPIIAHNLLFDIRPQIDINTLMEDSRIQNICNKSYSSYTGTNTITSTSQLTAKDVLTFLRCIEDLEHNKF